MTAPYADKSRVGGQAFNGRQEFLADRLHVRESGFRVFPAWFGSFAAAIRHRTAFLPPSSPPGGPPSPARALLRFPRCRVLPVSPARQQPASTAAGPPRQRRRRPPLLPRTDRQDRAGQGRAPFSSRSRAP